MRRMIVVTVLGVLAASPALAQNPQKGTFEIGGFGRYNWYDKSFNVTDSTKGQNSWGGGGRLGYFFSPKWNLELDGSANATDLNFPQVSSLGLVYWPFHLGVNYNAPLSERFSWLIGPRVNYNRYTTSSPTTAFTDKDFAGDDWGAGAITGFRYKLSEVFSIRLDGTLDYIPSPQNDPDGTNTMWGAQAGLSAWLGGKCKDKLDSIRVEPKSQDVRAGDRAGLRVTGYECDGDVIDATGTSTARITSGQGNLSGMSFTGTQPGCVDIEVTNATARKRGTDTARICVQAPPPPPRVTLDRCEISPASSPDVPPGESVTYTVTGFFSDGTSRALPNATLNADGGTVSGLTYTAPTADGTYTITAQCGEGRSARASVTVRRISVLIRTMFAFGKAQIVNQTELDSLRYLADVLKRYPHLALTIYGHTDWVGSVASNERLGMRRIQAVVDSLASMGIDRARMDSWTKISFGECQPQADNRTRQGRALNRRVGIWDSRSAPAQEGSGKCRERP